MKQKLAPRFLVKTLSPLLVLGALSHLTYAQTTRTWDGGGVPNTNLDIPANWSGDVVPSGATADVAQWDGSVPGTLGTLSLTYTAAGAGTGANLAAGGGIHINILGTQTEPIVINQTSGTAGLRIRDLTVASGAGPLTFGGQTGTDYLNLGSTAVLAHTWTNNSSNPVTFSPDITIGAGGAATHGLTLTGTGNWDVKGSLIKSDQGIINVIKSGSGKMNLGTVNSLGNASFTINSGTIENISGAALTTVNTTQIWNGDFTFSNVDSTTANDLNLGTGAANLGPAAGTSRTVTTNGAALLTLGGVLANGTTANSLIKSGTGALKLDGASTFSGGFTLNAGTIHLGSNTALGTGTFTINGGVVLPRIAARTMANPTTIAADATLGVNNFNNQLTFTGPISLVGNRTVTIADTTVANDVVFTGAISGGGLTKTGVGTLALSGVSTLTGPITVTSGLLRVDGTGSVNGSSGIVVNGVDAKFLYTSTAASTPPVTITEGTFDATGTVGAISVGGVNPVILANGNATGGKLTTGNLSFAGNATVDVAVTNAGAGIAAATLTTSGQDGAITLRVAKSDPWTVGKHNLISYSSFPNADINDFVFLAGAVPQLGARQNYGDLVINGNNIAIEIFGTSIYWTGLSSDQWTWFEVDAPKNWKVTAGNAPTDFGDADDVVFNDTPTTNQTVRIEDNPVLPTSVTFNNSVRTYNFVSTNTNGIASGTVIKNGTASVSFATNNIYAGGTVVNAGTLNANSATAFGTGPVTVNGGALGNTSGGQIVLTNNNVQTWNGDFTFSGTSDLDMGTGAVTVAGTSDRAVTVSSGTLAVGELKTAVGQGFTKQGPGKLALTSLGDGAAASVVNGTLNLAGGTLQINRSTGTNAATTGDLTVTSLSGTGTVTNGSSHERWLFINGAGPHTFAGSIANGGTGALGLNKPGNSTLVLSGANAYSGTTTVPAGTLSITGTNSAGGIVNLGGSAAAPAVLNLQNSNALGTSVVNATNRNNGIQLQGGITLPASVTFVTSNDGTSNATVPASFHNISGNNTIQGAISLTLGGGGSAFQVDSGTLTVTSNISILAGQTSRGIVLQGASTEANLFSGVLSDLSATSIANIVKSGTGTWTVSGTNTYTGTTNITGGKLIINGNHAAATGAVNVSADATLAGTGSLGGNVTIAANGIHSLAVAATPGAQVARTIGGILTHDAGSVLNVTAATPPAEGVYTLVTATGGITGIPTLTGLASGTLSISGNSLVLTVGTATSGYASWATSKGLTGANNGATQDPDFDGISNILEFVLDGNPLGSDTAKLPVSTQDANNFYFDFNRRNDSLAEVALTFEHGTTLATWPSSVAIPASSTPVVGPPVTITDNGDGTHHVKVTVPKSGATKLFGRLKAVK